MSEQENENCPTSNPNLFLHTADLHLSPRSSSIVKRDPSTNRLIRELDMETAFVASVNDALAQSPLPSAYVIAGDVFDTHRGSFDAFITLMRQIRRLRAAGIEIVAISGNHDTPTNLLKTPMYKILMDTFANDNGVHLSYDSISHVLIGNIEYVLLPHICCLRGDFGAEDLVQASEADYTVLVVHGVAEGDASLTQMDEVKEVPVAKWILDMPWDYVAFGHYHKPGWIPNYKGKAAYSGSLENTVISGPDVCMRRGPVYVDMEKDGIAKYDMHELPIRNIVELPDIEIGEEELTAEDLDKKIVEIFDENDTDEAIVRHKVKGITHSLYKSMKRRNFQSLNPNALYIKTDYEFAVSADDQTSKAADGSEEDVSLNNNENFLPLGKEVDAAIDLLITKGKITANKKEAIHDAIHAHLS